MLKHFASLLTIAALLITTGCTVVSDGEVGISKSFGTINERPLGPGVYLLFPVMRSVEKWGIKLRELTYDVSVPSAKGMMVDLQATILVRIAADEAGRSAISYGDAIFTTLLEPKFKASLRSATAGGEVEYLYSSTGRTEIRATVLADMQKQLAPAFSVEDVLLRKVVLPPSLTDAIANKLSEQQKIEAKGFQLQQAQKDAEIEVARAEGAAKAQRIIQSTLSDSYLHYLWIQTLNANPNVMYVATEANLPLFKGTK